MAIDALTDEVNGPESLLPGLVYNAHCCKLVIG